MGLPVLYTSCRFETAWLEAQPADNNAAIMKH